MSSMLKKLFKKFSILPKKPSKTVPLKRVIKKKVAIKKEKITKKKRSIKKKQEKEATFSSISKAKSNPIIIPDSKTEWRAWQTFNPTAIYLNNKVHLLYRAVGNDGISRFGYANSTDGFHIDEHPTQPAYQEKIEIPKSIPSIASGGSFAGCEDPRMVHIEDEDTIYITYTSCINGLRVALSSINTKDFLAKRWNWKPAQHISPPHEVHKNWVLFPEKINNKYAILHALNPISIAYLDTLDFNDTYIASHYSPGKPTDDRWDSYIRGAGPPPIKTKYGWLLLYHAMNHQDMSKYKVGAMLLDLNDPTKILHRSHAPLLVPEEPYENNGYKGGVVYTLGAVIKGDNLLLYYGGADSHVCVAYTNLEEFLRELRFKGKRDAPLQQRELNRAIKK